MPRSAPPQVSDRSDLLKRDFGEFRRGLRVMVRILSLAALLAALGGRAFAAAPDPADSAGRPNVVFIVADDMGYADLGTQGAQGFKTPHLDRLAGEGTRLTSFYVAQAVCTASRAALMTGCYPNRIGMQGAYNHTSRDGIADAEWLLPEMFKARGYATAGMGKWHLGTRPRFHPLRHGFDEWLGIPYSNDNSKYHPSLAAQMPPLPLYDGEQVVELDPDQSQFTRRFTERAIEFIERNASRPFFLYLAHVMPHVPIFASEKFKGRSPAGLYGDVLEELDWSVGEVLATLRRLGLDERTLVIFISDNGPFLSYGEHAGSAKPLREGKLTTFEGGVRVPCLVRWPGRVPAGRVCADPFMGIDWLPTLTEIVGGKAPALKIDGLSAKGLILGEKEARPPHEALFFYSGTALQAVRKGPWKLHFPHPYITPAGEPGRGGKPSNWGQLAPTSITQSGVEGIATRHGYRIEQLELSLFNLESDPGERQNLAPAHSDVVKRLSALADEARRDLGDSLQGVKGAGLRAPGVDVVAERPNILLILADDHGYGDVSAYHESDVRTPNIDRIGAEGTLFTAMRANCTVCSPSRAALITGRYADRVGVPGVIRTRLEDSWGFFDPQVPTIADELKKVGYDTAIIGKWHLGLESPNTPNERGFDFFHGFLGDMMDSYTTHLRHGNNYMRRNAEVIEPRGHATEIFSGWAADYLRERAKEPAQPFFLYLSFNAPHFPIEPPAEWLAQVKRRAPQLDEKRTRNVALVEHLDDNIGRVLSTLQETGLEQNTIVVYTADNGGSLPHGQNNDPWRDGKQSHYDGGLRVPFLVRWPGRIQAGSRCDYAGLNFDLFPTFLELAGAKPAADLDAVSLVPLLEGRTITTPRDLYFVRREGGLVYGGKSYEAIIRGDWKLMQNDPYSPLELYNLKDDPQERHNLAATNKQVFNELAAALRAHIQRGGGTPWQRPGDFAPRD